MRDTLSFLGRLIAVSVVCAAGGWILTNVVERRPAQARSAARPPATPATPASGSAHTGIPLHPPRGQSYVAVALHPHLSLFRSPARGTPLHTLRNPVRTNTPLTLLVKQMRRQWARVYLPMRPNNGTAWVQLNQVRILRDPWSLTVLKRRHRILVRRDGKLVRTFPVAIGKPSTPTPIGTYFLVELLKQPDPQGEYGPWAFGTSDYSYVIRHFGRGGVGQIGVHGTNQPWVIGHSASHGCIRLHNDDIRWLSRRLPLGTPLHITTG